MISKLSPNVEKSEVLRKIAKINLEYLVLEQNTFLFDAFKESPLIGHGSWAKDSNYKYTLMGARQKNDFQGKTDHFIIKKLFKGSVYKWDVPPIPKHSFVMQTTLWAGLIASSFFLLFIKCKFTNYFK